MHNEKGSKSTSSHEIPWLFFVYIYLFGIMLHVVQTLKDWKADCMMVFFFLNFTAKLINMSKIIYSSSMLPLL